MSCAIAQPGPEFLPPAAESRSLPSPRELKDFRGHHAGETILVCGCGSSLSDVVSPERFITIGVNDVGRLFQPDYLVVLNPKQQFRADRFRFVEESRASAIFTQLDLSIRHPHIVRFRLGKFGGVDFSDPNTLNYTRNSPYLAVCLAVHCGARKIGLIGVDFTDHHFFAATGRHALATGFAQIDREYKLLYDACSRRGIELVNLSQQSRLTALPKISPQEFARTAVAPPPADLLGGRKIFFVNYKFLSCGDVFRDGLTQAASDLKLIHDEAYWDDASLPNRVRQCAPDLLFVVHGRRFSQRWKNGFEGFRSAVWLLDEPYEVDDTARFSNLFDTVFINDPATLHRHRNAHYLPVCYDPEVYSYRPGVQRPYAVGFIGGFNPHREEALVRLAQRGMLSYVVGGPWRNANVNALCKSKNIPARETADLYRSTQIVVNLFRSQHHFNNSRIAAVSLNPRVYEGLACGALVISEHRPELDTICPEMPTFRTLEEMEFQIERHLRDPELLARVRKDCIRRFAPHTYCRRLSLVMSKTMSEAEVNVSSLSIPAAAIGTGGTANELVPSRLPPDFDKDWESDIECVQVQADGSVRLQKTADDSPGTERGLTGKVSYRNLAMEFEVFLQANTTFIAKLHQPEARNHLANSYHLMCQGERAYLARHHHIFCDLTLPLEAWVPISFSFWDGTVVVRRNGAEVARIQDRTLEAGYCFLGIKGGTAQLRNVRIETSAARGCHTTVEHDVLRAAVTPAAAKVSIVTTVYDRVACLERCLRSVQALNFKDHEHIIVADAPPAPVLRQIEEVTARYGSASARLTLANLKVRRNDWGISPAAVGLALARAEYVCFLSDDNGYAPDHFDKLVAALDQDPNLGFVYSSCLYDGRVVLNASVPGHGKIDLGQPLFRRDLFEKHLAGTLPFREICWDWRMIENFTRRGVRWAHLNQATFIFRLAKYPQLMPPEASHDNTPELSR